MRGCAVIDGRARWGGQPVVLSVRARRGRSQRVNADADSRKCPSSEFTRVPLTRLADPSTVGCVPQKRDGSLIPLSHDHHHGLVRVFEIRQALRSAEGLERQAHLTCECYESVLMPHFRAEEDVLIPVLRETGALDEAVLQRLLDEHRTLARLAGELATNTEPLRRFADLLERHIRTEEREIFPAYQTHVPVGRRSVVEAQVRRILNRPDDHAKVCDIRDIR